MTKRAAPKATSVSKKRKVDKDLTPSSLEPGASVSKKRKVDKDLTPSSLEPGASVLQRKKRKTTSSAAKNDGNIIDPNQCCVCFRTFEDDEVEKTGLEWVKCVCNRWLHEDCIDYATNVATDGQDLLCPYCCV